MFLLGHLERPKQRIVLGETKMKTQLTTLFTTALVLSANAFAVYDPSWERPILTADDMEITSATQAFEKAKKVDLTLTRRDGQKKVTGMVLSVDYPHSNKPVVTTLKVDQITKDDCGSTVYYAHLPSKPSKGGMDRRFSVTLTDHAARLCDDYKPFRWEASVREGYGWCGTFDATMSMQGEPQGVITILSTF